MYAFRLVGEDVSELGLADRLEDCLAELRRRRDRPGAGDAASR